MCDQFGENLKNMGKKKSLNFFGCNDSLFHKTHVYYVVTLCFCPVIIYMQTIISHHLATKIRWELMDVLTKKYVSYG